MEPLQPRITVQNTTEGALVTLEHKANAKLSIAVTTLVTAPPGQQGALTLADISLQALQDGAALIQTLIDAHAR